MGKAENIFDLTAPLLSREKLRVLLIGGHAFREYGMARQTLDVDWLCPDRFVPGIKKLLTEAGFSETAGTKNFIRFHRPGGFSMELDILIVDDNTFDAIYRESVPAESRGGEWRVPRLLHLVMLKLHAMKNNPKRKSRDSADIIEALEHSGNEISEEDLRSACGKYGPEGIYDFLTELRG